MTEELILTKEQVESAKKDRSHVVVSILDSLGKPYWDNLLGTAAKYNGNSEKQKIYEAGVVPFAEQLEGGDFTLSPFDLISIWTRALEISPNSRYLRHSLSTAIACAYASNPIESEHWKHLFKKIQEDSRSLRAVAEKDKVNRKIFKARLKVIDKSLDDLDFYKTGTKEDIIELVRKMVAGDKEAGRRVQEIEEWKKEHEGYLIGEISENWANGASWMYSVLG